MRALVLLLLCACGESPSAGDGGLDADLDRKIPPQFDASDAAITGPDHLSATGLYSDFASRTLSAGIITYEPRFPLWSDGAEKKRYVLLPAGQTIDTSAMDDWAFPEGTKAWKEFSVGTTVVETRMLWKKPEGWFEMAYVWQADGSDAVAAPSGVPNALGTTHDVPSQQDCNECHSNVRDVLIGVSALQLGASDGDGTLASLAAAKRLSAAPAATYDVPGTGDVKDALGYLHGNCAHCHNDGSALRNQTHMRLRVAVGDTTPEQTGAYRTAPFLAMKHVIPTNHVVYALVPSQPDMSGIAVRMGDRSDGGNVDDPWAMPPVCTKIIDPTGLATVRAWIASMPCGAGCVSAPNP